MTTNRTLAAMDVDDRHQAIYEALENAQLQDLIPCRWSCEDHEGCGTAWMLRVVCLEQNAERRVQLDSAINFLRMGHTPRGATPYPDAAEALLHRRGA